MTDLKIRSILVASDLSDTADRVVGDAAAIAAVIGADLHVVTVVEPSYLPAVYPAMGETAVEMHRRIQETRQGIDAQIERVLPEHFAVASRYVAYDSPYRAILNRADEIKADLVVIGPHRPRPFGARLLGKTADRLVRSLSVPCLVLRGHVTLPLARVLVPTDLSPASRVALDTAIDWAVALRREDTSGAATKLRVVHVAPWFLGGESLPNQRLSMGDVLHSEVDAAVERAGGDLLLDVEEEVIWGDAPADDILQAAIAPVTDLIVIGTHGNGAIARALIGSVSSAVVRDAECPVLLVPPSAARVPLFSIEEADLVSAESVRNEISPVAQAW
jgi:nucleotide-binding universal stress UspA family protein